jgi:hypothetical protein
MSPAARPMVEPFAYASLMNGLATCSVTRVGTRAPSEPPIATLLNPGSSVEFRAMRRSDWTSSIVPNGDDHNV